VSNDFSLGTAAMSYVCLLFALCVHEASHAAMADRCGDPSARFLGRLSLNPLVHIDLVGTVIIPLVIMFTGSRFLIGWAKPVPVNPRNFRNMRRDQVLVALAGPASNLVLAITVALLLRIVILITGGQIPVALEPVLTFGLMLAFINVVLLVFNLLPIPPLDGSWVLHYFLPPSGQRMLEQIAPFGILLILLVGRKVIIVPLAILWGLLRQFVLGA